MWKYQASPSIMEHLFCHITNRNLKSNLAILESCENGIALFLQYSLYNGATQKRDKNLLLRETLSHQFLKFFLCYMLNTYYHPKGLPVITAVNCQPGISKIPNRSLQRLKILITYDCWILTCVLKQSHFHHPALILLKESYIWWNDLEVKWLGVKSGSTLYPAVVSSNYLLCWDFNPQLQRFVGIDMDYTEWGRQR